MNKRTIWILSAALLSGVSLAAIASNHAMDKSHAHRSHGQHHSAKGHEAHLAELEKSLQLKDNQRSAWDAYAKTMNDMAQAHEKNRDAMQSARQALMSQLSPEQQKTLQSMHGEEHGKGKRKGHDREGHKSSHKHGQH